MPDFFEIDFLDVESDKSGDAIAIRYSIGDSIYIHVVDGGFQDTGESLCAHIDRYYGPRDYIDNAILTHPDGDHAGGLHTLLEDYEVGVLWMLRPWLYAAELIHRFPRVTSVERLQGILREAYPNVAALEEIALRRNIPIEEPFQGARIGAFHALAPSKSRYLELVARSKCTPESDAEKDESALARLLKAGAAYARTFARAAWGEEVFSPQGVSEENEMSVVQYAELNQMRILLTADAGREALTEAIAFAPYVGLNLPGIDRFQVPHHGSRRNVTSELLDQLLGTRLTGPPAPGQEAFTAIISAAKDDEAHPRKAIVRAMIHRGAKAISTEGMTIQTHRNAPDRGWTAARGLAYPADQEE